ncbi:MAG: peptidoglycan-associated lipoprotein Pal [Rhodobacteraceae bacterium]|nr:peptidoglycan-associated lipoprotein Pal [Paracoccaceae bacterium]
MKQITRVVLLCAALTAGACTNGNRFDNGGFNDGIGSGNFDVDADPSSPVYFQQTVGDRVFFTVDQHVLTDDAKFVLSSQASWLRSNADYLAVVEGHADEQGTREYNLALGARRANAVMEYLIAQGVPRERLKFVTYGKERPIEICSEEACYSKNRRAVTIISAGLGL